MRQAVSEDGGETWTPFEPNGLHCVVAPNTIVPISGGRLLAVYHSRDDDDWTIRQSVSRDGGLTWGPEEVVLRYPAGRPCEPAVVKSPDGERIAMLIRENSRRYNSLISFSDDEGETWTAPVELPASLTGDRHMPRYAEDGRLLITFRDMAQDSPTRGDFVLWVGRFDDLVEGREGEYRARLLTSYGKPADTGYAGLERLPDGSFVAVTYAPLKAGAPPSVIAVRLRLIDLDQQAATLKPRQEPLFISGQRSYAIYRIPALYTTSDGTVLAFCEGRVDGLSDSGDIDLLLRRSTDGGRTWSPQQVVWSDRGNTCGNPCIVEDRETGTLWLLLTHNLGQDSEHEIVRGTSEGTRTVWVTRSQDEGLSWDTPRELTADTKRPEWTWYATGPGVGIQMRVPPYEGRLVIPCDHQGPDGYFSHAIYSDDSGGSWQLGGRTEDGTNECQVIERADGSLLLNMRTHGGTLPTDQRMIATSDDGGNTWSAIEEDPVLPEPHCQASLIRYEPSDMGDRRVMFSNPASTEGRVEMTVRLSDDEGATWAFSKLVHPGPSAYSCLTVLPDGSVGLLYEKGQGSPYESITFVRLPLAYLRDGM
jgi:sialidase-1